MRSMPFNYLGLGSDGPEPLLVHSLPLNPSRTSKMIAIIALNSCQKFNGEDERPRNGD